MPRHQVKTESAPQKFVTRTPTSQPHPDCLHDDHQNGVPNFAKMRTNSASATEKYLSMTKNFIDGQVGPYFIVSGERSHSLEQPKEERDATKLRNGSCPMGKDSSSTTFVDHRSTGLAIAVQPSVAAH